MAEQVSASKRVQLGYEPTAGTAVAATIKFHANDISMSLNPEMQAFQPKGSRYSKGVLKNREWSKLSLGGLPDYNELTYIFESVFKKVSATRRQHRQDPFNRAFYDLSGHTCFFHC